MVYLGGGTWVDIYLNSDDGAKGLKSEYGCAPMTGTESMNWYRLCRLQTQGNAQESTKGQHKAHKAYYQEVRERENHKRAVTKEYTELDGTRRTRRQL